VDGIGQFGANSVNGSEGVGPRTKMCYFSQELKTVAFLLKRVNRVGFTDQVDRFGGDFLFLAFALRMDQLALHSHRSAG
jgi:hypothetical protein